jgi:predicted RNA-binding protein YlxR (DUF448 family)
MRIPRNEPLGSARSGKAGGGSDAPERRCVLTGRHGGRDELLRLAISPADEHGECLVLPDAMARAPGRGAWLGVTRAELEEAMAKGKLKAALARAFKDGKLTVPEDLPARIEAALLKSLTDRLGLEMRAGKVLLGSDRIANEARSGKVAVLYHAADASADGARKLDQAWRVGLDEEGSGLVGNRLPLDRDALSVALGRDNVVHLALADAASAGRVQAPLGRLLAWLGTGIAADNDGADEAGEAPLDPAPVN